MSGNTALDESAMESYYGSSQNDLSLLENSTYEDDSNRRVIVITVCLNERVTNHSEGYQTLINALMNLH